VLIVDDDADVRDVVTAVLELSGFEVRTMRDGIDALDLPEEYDAILLDVHMPVFDGERLLDYWHMTNPALLDKVIVMTGYSHRQWRVTTPPFAILQKPFRHEQIVSVVTDCAARSRGA
jgi:DNA-binding NtrC family response regulator